ncbi:unnamed protein product [Acanthosepion pharaonis]|uniref:Uncharacterized protein n=1 Tax=Acanthosepion pharaonis TaxID=158019 RepID=A0A812B536_ACAPH|nr:unnamed protein product [Sepia pharaonis]
MLNILVAIPGSVPSKDLNEGLLLAAKEGYTECVDCLIKAGADIDTTDNSDQTPFYLAVCNNKIPSALFLLKAGNECDALANNGFAAIHIAYNLRNNFYNYSFCYHSPTSFFFLPLSISSSFLFFSPPPLQFSSSFCFSPPTVLLSIFLFFMFSNSLFPIFTFSIFPLLPFPFMFPCSFCFPTHSLLFLSYFSPLPVFLLPLFPLMFSSSFCFPTSATLLSSSYFSLPPVTFCFLLFMFSSSFCFPLPPPTIFLLLLLHFCFQKRRK